MHVAILYRKYSRVHIKNNQTYLQISWDCNTCSPRIYWALEIGGEGYLFNHITSQMRYLSLTHKSQTYLKVSQGCKLFLPPICWVLKVGRDGFTCSHITSHIWYDTYHSMFKLVSKYYGASLGLQSLPPSNFLDIGDCEGGTSMQSY